MGGGIEYLSVARPSAPTRKDRRDRQRPSATSRATGWGRGDLVSEKQLVCSANRCFNSCAEQSHKDSVQKATVEEQLGNQTIRPAQYENTAPPPCSCSLLGCYVVVVGFFYIFFFIALFYALERTQCALIACDSQ